MSIHTIWVPTGQSVEQTWEMLRRGVKVDVLPSQTGKWVNVDENGKFLK